MDAVVEQGHNFEFITIKRVKGSPKGQMLLIFYTFVSIKNCFVNQLHLHFSDL
jgi:hypothetical protein